VVIKTARPLNWRERGRKREKRRERERKRVRGRKREKVSQRFSLF
jgi:hypothetical protein